jgi:hypothetical protein
VIFWRSGTCESISDGFAQRGIMRRIVFGQRAGPIHGERNVGTFSLLAPAIVCRRRRSSA